MRHRKHIIHDVFTKGSKHYIGNYKAGIELLKRAEAHSFNNKKLKATTYNNFACFYGRTKRIRSALQYLEKAIIIERFLLNISHTHEEFNRQLHDNNPADSYLNLCVTYSQLGKHDTALQYGHIALLHMQDEVIDIVSLKTSEKKDARLVVLVIALHNIAVENEHLKYVIS